jgi:hypothetical protein
MPRVFSISRIARSLPQLSPSPRRGEGWGEGAPAFRFRLFLPASRIKQTHTSEPTMPGFFDDPMFTSPDPTVMRYPGTPFARPLPPYAYSSAWPPPAAPYPPRPAAAPLPIPAARAPSLPAAPAAPAAAMPSVPQAPTNAFGLAFNNPLTNHAATLMALGAGIAQGGIGRGLAMASAAAENERNRQLQQMSFMQTYKALTDSGVPQQEAIAAVSNPSLMRTLAARYLGTRAQMNAAGRFTGGPTINAPPASAASPNGVTASAAGASPIPGVRQASDGSWYVPDPNRPGKYLMVH